MSEHGAELVIRCQTLRPVSWRNGGGITREIVAGGNKGGEGFDWRLSLATIQKSGRFSEFPGMERIFTVVEGDLVTLAVDGHTRHVHHGAPFLFTGDSLVQAFLPAGSAQALNVITRPSAISASVGVEQLTPGRARRLLPDQWAVLLSGRATLVADDTVVVVGVHDTVRGDRETVAEIIGEGLVAVVILEPMSTT